MHINIIRLITTSVITTTTSQLNYNNYKLNDEDRYIIGLRTYYITITLIRIKIDHIVKETLLKLSPRL